MQSYLPDVNVLVALFDPAHLRHHAGHKWFSKRGKTPWATCPITVNGCFRVLCRLAALSSPTPSSDLAQQLRELLALPGRVSFSTQPELTDEARFDLTKISGHNQCTDALLVAIAVQHQAKMLTFDRNIPWRAVRSASLEDIRLLSA